MKQKMLFTIASMLFSVSAMADKLPSPFFGNWVHVQTKKPADYARLIEGYCYNDGQLDVDAKFTLSGIKVQRDKFTFEETEYAVMIYFVKEYEKITLHQNTPNQILGTAWVTESDGDTPAEEIEPATKQKFKMQLRNGTLIFKGRQYKRC